MRKFLLIVFFTSLMFSQSETDGGAVDTIFIILNSEDSIRINKFEADFTFQPMLKLDLEFSDFDSAKYDISKVSKLVDSSGMDMEALYNLSGERADKREKRKERRKEMDAK